jgi:hypothetical protein
MIRSRTRVVKRHPPRPGGRLVSVKP